MCGRYTLRNPRRALDELLDLPQLPFPEPRYNIAPSQSVPVVRIQTGQQQRECVLVRWGLIPSWAADPKIGHRLINAPLRNRGDKAGLPGRFQATALPGAGRRVLRMEADRRQETALPDRRR